MVVIYGMSSIFILLYIRKCIYMDEINNKMVTLGYIYGVIVQTIIL